ncbi:MAG: riboflavin synthase [Bacteroidales bacterium]|nr:riboflavin synthase [Bacteroidales bacterium]
MFTGLIEEIGIVENIKWGTSSAQLTIAAKKVLTDLKVGDSVNTNGACLTVIKFDKKAMTVDVMTETINRTNLKQLTVGSMVNLERALMAGSRLGGHMVSGHIDGTGIMVSLKKDDIATWIKIQTDEKIMKYIVSKGSVALDGISLTIAGVYADAFEVSVIPHTSSETTLLKKRPGDKINIECDIIGKYVEKFLQKQESKTNNIDYDFLRQHGFTD